jgi:hypothetical protein
MSGVNPLMATWHLNLRWTVGDMDRVAFMRRNQHLTFDGVAALLKGTMLQASDGRLRELAEAFHITMARKAS